MLLPWPFLVFRFTNKITPLHVKTWKLSDALIHGEPCFEFPHQRARVRFTCEESGLYFEESADRGRKRTKTIGNCSFSVLMDTIQNCLV